jgi:hypothetical protein
MQDKQQHKQGFMPVRKVVYSALVGQRTTPPTATRTLGMRPTRAPMILLIMGILSHGSPRRAVAVLVVLVVLVLLVLVVVMLSVLAVAVVVTAVVMLLVLVVPVPVLEVGMVMSMVVCSSSDGPTLAPTSNGFPYSESMFVNVVEMHVTDAYMFEMHFT